MNSWGLGRVMFSFDTVGISAGLFCRNPGDCRPILIPGDFLLLALGFLGTGGGGPFLGREFTFKLSLLSDPWKELVPSDFCNISEDTDFVFGSFGTSLETGVSSWDDFNDCLSETDEEWYEDRFDEELLFRFGLWWGLFLRSIFGDQVSSLSVLLRLDELYPWYMNCFSLGVRTRELGLWVWCLRLLGCCIDFLRFTTGLLLGTQFRVSFTMSGLLPKLEDFSFLRWISFGDRPFESPHDFLFTKWGESKKAKVSAVNSSSSSVSVSSSSSSSFSDTVDVVLKSADTGRLKSLSSSLYS